MSHSDWYTTMNAYSTRDPIAASRAEPSKWDALPTRSYSTVREAGPSRANSQSTSGGAGISRYRAVESSYRTSTRTKHEPTSRGWGPTNSSAGPRKWEPETLNRSRTVTSTRRPTGGYGHSDRLVSKKESVLFSPGVDLRSYAGGDYYGGGKTSSIGRSKTVSTSSKRDSVYRHGVDLSSMAGGTSSGYKSTFGGQSKSGYAPNSFASRAAGASGYGGGYGGDYGTGYGGGYDGYY